MNSQERFNYTNSTGNKPPNKTVSTHGILYHNGKAITNPTPYTLLQTIKKQYINNGYKADDLKIRKHIP